MQHITTLLLAGGIMTATLLHAQTTQKEEKKEIAIEKKEGVTKEKMVIEIEGSKVTINGKPAEEYEGGRVIVTDDMVIMNKKLKGMAGAQSLGKMDWKADERPILGVMTEKHEKGVNIVRVNENTGAEKAGLKQNDVITKVNEIIVTTPEELTQAIRKNKIGDEIDITYLRDGKSQKVKAKLQKSNEVFAFGFEDDEQRFNMEFPRTFALPPMPDFPNEYRENFRGFAFHTDRPKYGMSIQDNEDGNGVKVTAIEKESNAEKAGLKENDIITELGGKPVKNVDTAREILGISKDEVSIPMKVLRNGAVQNLNMKVPRKLKTANL